MLLCVQVMRSCLHSPSPSVALCQACAALQASSSLGSSQGLEAGWDVLCAGHMSGMCRLLESFVSDGAVHKGHVYCVAELYLIQCLEAS